MSPGLALVVYDFVALSCITVYRVGNRLNPLFYTVISCGNLKQTVIYARFTVINHITCHKHLLSERNLSDCNE